MESLCERRGTKPRIITAAYTRISDGIIRHLHAMPSCLHTEGTTSRTI